MLTTTIKVCNGLQLLQCLPHAHPKMNPLAQDALSMNPTTMWLLKGKREIREKGEHSISHSSNNLVNVNLIISTSYTNEEPLETY